ncbi:MAG: hypothetical protein ABSG51_01135 [Terracidiphilus sp.]
MPEQWTSITGNVELEQSAPAEASKSSSATQVSSPADTHAALVRGLLYGAGVAVLGLPLYYLLIFLVHTDVGFVALPVGWLIGKAIKKGSRGAGGLRYQIPAVLLTYMVICIINIPVLWASMVLTYKNTEPQAGLILFMATYAPWFLYLRGIGGVIGELCLVAGLYIAYRTTANQRPAV